MDVSPPAQVNGETRSIFAIREAFHPTARPKHKMHIRFPARRQTGRRLTGGRSTPRRTASAYGSSDVRETRRTVRTKTSRLPRRSDQQRPRSRPFGRKQGAPKIARPRRGRRPARLSFYTERRGLSIPSTGISVPECGKAQGRPHLVRFLRHMHWIPARGRSESHAPRVGMRRSPPLVPACGKKRRGRGRKSPLPSRASRRPARRRGRFILLGANSSFGTPQSGQVQSSGRSAKGTPLRLLVIHIIADLANVLHSRFSSC